MKGTYAWVIVTLGLVAIAVILLRVSSLSREARDLGERNERALAALQDSLKGVQADLATAKELAPGLGEYMTTIQLHAGKLWFAAKAVNWELAEYELDELKETMEAAKALNAEKNGVKISSVLDSVLQTQIARLGESIRRKNQADFQKSYDETLSACNGCHDSAGYQFIHIVRPAMAPVTNQTWELLSKK
jgi:hypothetical protein